MSWFRKRASRRLLPADTARHLAAWGRLDFSGHTADLGPDTVQFIANLQIDRDVQANPDRAAEEIHEIAMAAGGWAICGGAIAIHGALPAAVGTESFESLMIGRARHLRALGVPTRELSPLDQMYRDRAFPDEP